MARPTPPAGNGLKVQLAQARGRAAAQWQALGERERLAVGGAGTLLGLLLAWGLLVNPALRTLRTAPAELEQVELQLQQMQAQAQEARALRAAPAVPPAQAQEALKASVAHLGAAARLNLAGELATVTLNGIAPVDLQAFLGEVRAAARARPVEAQLTRGPQGFTGSLVLSLGDA
ncbi:MAG: type II secretion system protein GspM [Roseateles sp.]|uniref:type II secretion system protein GspM n=1 Tax=Roseateles sp. TaxID=1971397 RepID=UPI0039E766F5